MFGRTFLISALVAFVALVYIAVAFVVAVMPGKTVSKITPVDYHMDYERVTLDTEDGLQLTGWFIANPDSRAAIIIGHGYPFDKGSVFPITHFLAREFNLLYVDFRYFGESQGRYTTFGLDERKDVAAAVEYLQKREGIDPDRIGQYGFSLSASTFIQAHHPGVRAMVLDSPFISLDAMIRRHFRYLGPLKEPFVWVAKQYVAIFLKRDVDQASAMREINGVTCPVLFIHGSRDRQIPPRQSQMLFAACPSQNKEYWLVEDADHGETMVKDREKYQERVRAFFLKYLQVVEK